MVTRILSLIEPIRIITFFLKLIVFFYQRATAAELFLVVGLCLDKTQQVGEKRSSSSEVACRQSSRQNHCKQQVEVPSRTTHAFFLSVRTFTSLPLVEMKSKYLYA